MAADENRGPEPESDYRTPPPLKKFSDRTEARLAKVAAFLFILAAVMLVLLLIAAITGNLS